MGWMWVGWMDGWMGVKPDKWDYLVKFKNESLNKGKVMHASAVMDFQCKYPPKNKI
jgi:hypothetical protein